MTMIRSLFSKQQVQVQRITSFSTSTTTTTTNVSQHAGFVEMREYTLHPSGMASFIKLAGATAALRASLLPFLGMFATDTGSTLNRVLHFYHYTDFDQRDAARAKAAATLEWTDFISTSRHHVSHQQSSIYLPAVPVLETASAVPIQTVLNHQQPRSTTSPPALFELRQYQLHPGYGSVPKLIEAFSKGIYHKIAAADAQEQGSLVYFGHSDVGLLNTVIELWRYPSAAACIRARQASRKVPEWRETIAEVTPGVQHFRSQFLTPLPFSLLQ